MAGTPAGFFEAADGFFAPLGEKVDELVAKFETPPPVYIVGHSLGGAMSGVVLGLSDLDVYHSSGARRRFPNLFPHSSFTFGMPRYGDEAAIIALRTPIHCLSSTDVVPHVPTRAMGFQEVSTEYLLKPNGSLSKLLTRPDEGIVTAAKRLDIRNHFIERYIERIGSHIP